MIAADESPAVSVIVATYNRANLLPETIDSILAQTFQNFELIVVDDGSTDNTRAVLERYGSRLRYFHQPNKGASAARNFGVGHARTSWIAFQDSDDLSTPTHLEALIGYVRQFPGYGMVFANGGYVGGAQHRHETIIPAAISRRLQGQEVTLVDLFEKSLVRLQASIIAKTAYESIGGMDESLQICEDLDFFFRLITRYRIAYLDRVVFLYRTHSGNLTENEELRLTENIRVIQKLMCDYPQARGLIGESAVARRLAYRYYRLAKGRWRCNRRDAARQAIVEAIRLRPFHLKYWFYRLQWGSALAVR